MVTSHQLNADKYAYETAYLKHWVSAEIDALIMPTSTWVGYEPGTWVSGSQYVGYTSIWNFLGYAALAVPVTVASREKDQPDREWATHVPRNESDRFTKEQCKFSFRVEPCCTQQLQMVDVDNR